ncbi:SIMPL domain-containing protein [Rickettsia rhipicephali]|uniref:SIMPL domain-containing protein n=1 Tax=Rickettsia rhipicephali TaxID=33992 RepID=UPI00224D218B|nr:SIMPL domain-containing protein [Rickettsia rhipicephali]MCX4079879.1 SIMPL domain-containing protein [Rickettsia rhipicephali]
MDVQEDLLISSIRIEEEGVDPKSVQNAVNLSMAAAIKIAKQPDINVSTGQYNIYQYIYQYDEEQNTSNKEKRLKKKKWRGSQVLSLQSRTPEALLSVIGQLQNEGLLIQNLNYTLSNDKRDAIRNSMIESAIAKLKQQATRIAKALGQEYSRFTMINIDTGLGARPPIAMYRNAAPALGMMSDAAVIPSAEPGTSTVSITVSATALLK